MISLNNVFLQKGITGVALNTFPNVLLMFNICQSLLMISLIFGKVGLCITKNGITIFHTASVLFNRVDPSKPSTFSIWFRMMVSFYPFSANKKYSFLVKEDVQNLHGNNFGSQLIFLLMVVCKRLLWFL